MSGKISAIDVLKEVMDLKERKSQDYQGSQFTEEDYFPFGDKSYIHMIHTKYLRMRSVVEQKGVTNYESLEDTLVDMCAYAAMYVAWIRNQDSKPKLEPADELDMLRGRKPRV